MMNHKLPAFFYGGDYNPDQWPDEIQEEDIRQMKVHHVNAVTLPVFSWAKLQPSEEEFDFLWLDRILDKLYQNGIFFILATPTAAQPAWMSKRYPDILPVDLHGRKRKHGGRTNFCPNSPSYRKFSKLIAEKMAQRYGKHPGLLMWHINNEYGSYCYCDRCSTAFQEWLKARYGTIEELNRKWNTAFWSHTYYEWDEIEAPSALNEILPGRLGGRDGTNFQGMAIDYRRFMSDSILECFRNEVEAVKQYTPEIPVTTNIWGIAPALDLYEWNKYTDVASWDNYPSNKDHPADIAMRHDIIRGLKGGLPFLLMEQTPNQQNWQDYNALKRPGVMRLQSYQAVAHGADGIMFFQWRQSIGACEKYHAAMVPHVGHENTRIGRELTQLGTELHGLQDKVLGARINAEVAILLDWPNWWAVEYSSGPSIDLKYMEQIQKYYRVLYDMNIPVDFVQPTGDLTKYKMVIAPVLYMVETKAIKNIEQFVQDGGIFITTFFSGIVDENDLVILGGYPGAFRKLLGIWVEETDALFPDMRNEMVVSEEAAGLNGRYACRLICDVVHLEGARALATFGKDYYAGYPCITENTYDKGKAIYIASEPEDELLKGIIRNYCKQSNVEIPFQTPEGIEVTQRKKGDKTFTFILNHNDSAEQVLLPDGEYKELLGGQTVRGNITIPSKGVFILER